MFSKIKNLILKFIKKDINELEDRKYHELVNKLYKPLFNYLRR